MKTILCILFALSSLTAFSQSDTSSNRKVTFGLSLIPEVNNLIANSPIGQESVESKMGFSAGIHFEFQCKKRIYFRTGIGYGKKNYSHTQNGLIFGTDLDPQTGIIIESRLESQVSFSEFQIPLVLKYELKEDKLFIASGAEIIKPFANNSERIIYHGSGKIEKLSNADNNGFNLAPVLSVGYKFPVSNKLSISMEPFLKYYLREYIIFESNLFNYGLRTTINFGL